FGAWTGGLQAGQTIDPLAPTFAAQASNFYHANNNTNNSGASVFSVLVLMYSFMYDYTLWAEECPHFDPHGTTSSPELTLFNDVSCETATFQLTRIGIPPSPRNSA